jgi:hypothetical protein
MQALVSRGYLGAGQLVALVMSGRRPIWRSASTHSIQVCGVEAHSTCVCGGGGWITQQMWVWGCDTQHTGVRG